MESPAGDGGPGGGWELLRRSVLLVRPPSVHKPHQVVLHQSNALFSTQLKQSTEHAGVEVC